MQAELTDGPFILLQGRDFARVMHRARLMQKLKSTRPMGHPIFIMITSVPESHTVFAFPVAVILQDYDIAQTFILFNEEPRRYDTCEVI